MLAYLPIATPSSFETIEPIIKPSQRNGLRMSFDAYHLSFRNAASSVGDHLQQRDFLYFDQRVCGALMPWRDFFCGIHLNPINPLLDKNILEFFRHLPYSARRVRALYKKTVQSLYPDLFSSRRAVFYGSGYDISRQISQGSQALRQKAQQLSPQLKPYIDASILEQWIDSVTEGAKHKESPLKNIAKLCLKGTFLPELVRSFSSRNCTIRKADVISRVLTVDSTLKLLSS